MSPATILTIFLVIKIIQFIFFLALEKLNRRSVQIHQEVPEKFRETITQEEFIKSKSYTISKQNFVIASHTFDLALLFCFIFMNGFGYLENLSADAFSQNTLRGAVFFFSIIIGKSIISIPVEWFKHFKLEKKYGFNKLTPALFFSDYLKSLILTLIFGMPLVIFLIWLIEIAGPLWWFYGGIGITLYQFFVILIYPTYIAPMFNKFTPLEEGTLRSAIMAIAKKVSFNISEIYMMDGSKRTNHSNAYFTGLGKSRRIVLFDTLAERLNTDELVTVLAHEMGHNRLKHIKKGLLLSTIVTFFSFFIWSLLINSQLLYKAFGMTGEHRFSALILLPLVTGPVAFFMAPLFNWISRNHEFEADEFAAKATEKPDSLKNALLTLNKENLSNLTPHKLYSTFYYSHPTLDERLDALNKLI